MKPCAPSLEVRVSGISAGGFSTPIGGEIPSPSLSAYADTLTHDSKTTLKIAPVATILLEQDRMETP